MNEVFGEENLVCQLVWKSRQNEDTRAKTGVSVDHEYVVCYGRSETVPLRGAEKDLAKFSNPDDDPRGPWRSADLTGLATADRRPNLHYELTDPATGTVYECPPKGWRFDRSTMARKIEEGRVLFPENGQGRPRHKLFVNEMASQYKNITSVIQDFNTGQGTREANDLLGDGVMDFPKPSALPKLLCAQAAPDGSDLILDFFSGSCTTAQAVLELNREDGGNRRFIMVQLPEPTGREDFPTIAEIGKERIRRVIARMKQGDAGKLDLQDREQPEDLGFRVFKLQASNLQGWAPVSADDEAAVREQLQQQLEPLKEGWTEEAVIAEIALKEGFGLTYGTERVEGVRGNVVYRVTDPDRAEGMYVCLDERLSDETWRGLKLSGEYLFVCRDRALTDTQAANLALQCRLHVI